MQVEGGTFELVELVPGRPLRLSARVEVEPVAVPHRWTAGPGSWRGGVLRVYGETRVEAVAVLHRKWAPMVLFAALRRGRPVL